MSYSFSFFFIAYILLFMYNYIFFFFNDIIKELLPFTYSISYVCLKTRGYAIAFIEQLNMMTTSTLNRIVSCVPRHTVYNVWLSKENLCNVYILHPEKRANCHVKKDSHLPLASFSKIPTTLDCKFSLSLSLTSEFNISTLYYKCF